MKRIIVLTKADFNNEAVNPQNIFRHLKDLSTPLTENDFEVLIFENQVIANRYGDVGLVSEVGVEKLIQA